MQIRRVGPLARGGQLLLAVAALAARDAEAVDDTVAGREPRHGGADRLDDAAELMAENVTLFRLHDNAMQEVHVAAADGGARHLNDHVVVVDDFGLGGFDWFVGVSTVL